jgi:hypothetical protein
MKEPDIERIDRLDTEHAKLLARPPRLFRCFLVGLLQGFLIPLYAVLLLQTLIHFIHGPWHIRVGWLIAGVLLTAIMPTIGQLALHWALGTDPRLYGLGSRQSISVFIALFTGTLLTTILVAAGVLWFHPIP